MCFENKNLMVLNPGLILPQTTFQSSKSLDYQSMRLLWLPSICSECAKLDFSKICYSMCLKHSSFNQSLKCLLWEWVY